ncbi:Ig-like domain-containing protein [Aquimarina algiphila]|uniref:Ig-like domain-containing protein n=1 Tax=Aquimarina algiphila TaxID=2047982 RepID=UPI00232C54CC|nr:PKD domain-containing protein [Aquimarina algiphila]
MKRKLSKYFLLTSIVLNVCLTYSQSDQPQLVSNNQQTFIDNLINPKKNTSSSIKTAGNQELSLTLNLQKEINNDLILIGNINNDRLSTFTFSKTSAGLTGEIVVPNQKKAYTLYSEADGKVFIKETNINDVLCVDLEKSASGKNQINGGPVSKTSLQLESLPGATGVIYLDFDGELVSGTSWLGGATIDAQSPNFSDEKIIEIWKIMAEDFRPFNLNITTRRDLFEAAPRNRRMMCIFTPTTDAAPGSGGVAYLNSFSRNNDNPCWVYNLGTRSAGETGSHEVGHTLGLSHDGQGSTEYYNGHGQWSPIMGWSASRPIGQWSAGEYNGATSSQDDIAIIANTRNGIGFQNDDHGDDITNATPLRTSPAGDVNTDQNFGLISTREDKDVFSFVIETGNVSFSFRPDPDYPNLNIQARILNELGQEVLSSDPSGLSASINENLTEGIYYIEIDGVGEGNPNNGYSDYASLGNYTISGSYILGDDNQPPLSEFEANTDCSTVNFINSSTNRINSYLWDFGDGQTSTQENPTHTYASVGNYTVSLTTTNDSGSNTEEKIDFVTIAFPNQPAASDQNACSGESITITASGNSNYRWYTVPTGGISLNTGSTYETPNLTTNTTYYIEGVIGTCITATRTPVNVTVSPSPDQPTASNQEICSPESVTITVSGNSEYRWYEMPTEGTSIASGATFNTPVLESSKTYYIEGFIGSCVTPTRTEVTITVSGNPDQPVVSDQNICTGESTTITVSGNSQYQWYETPTGGTSIASGITYETPELTADKTYYIEGTSGSCITATRTEVNIIVSEIPEQPLITVTPSQNLSVSSNFVTYQWYYNDEVIDEAIQAEYIPTETGEYTVTVANQAGCSITSEKFVVDQSLLNLRQENKTYTYYPNPVNDNELLNIDGFTAEDYDLRIVNIQGQVLIQSTPTPTMDISELSQGLYIILVNNKAIGKFMKE